MRHWFFVDNIFNMPIRHAKEICEEIAARELDIEWSGYLNPKFIDDELCALMARSGCKAIEFGTDSGSADDDRQPEEGVRRRRPARAPRRSATSTS